MPKTLAAQEPRKLAYSIEDVQELTGLGRSFLYEQIKAESLPIRKAGRRSLIFADDLKAWLSSLPSPRAG